LGDLVGVTLVLLLGGRGGRRGLRLVRFAVLLQDAQRDEQVHRGDVLRQRLDLLREAADECGGPGVLFLGQVFRLVVVAAAVIGVGVLRAVARASRRTGSIGWEHMFDCPLTY